MDAAARHASMPAGCQNDVPLAFSRAISDPLGKLDDRLEEMRIDSETKALLQVQAVRNGMTLAGWVRFICQVQAHGIERVRSLHLRQFDEVGNLLSISKVGE